MATYIITTDGGTQTVEADSVAAALEQAGPYGGRQIRTLAEFAAWLIDSGGYGSLDEDGITLVRVRA